MDTAKLLANFGERVLLLKAKNKLGLKTPDAMLNETKFDFKNIDKCTKSSVFNNLRTGKKQARHTLLHLSDINKNNLMEGMLEAIRKDKLGEIQGVMVIYKNKRMFVHRSEIKESLLSDIIKKAFNI